MKFDLDKIYSAENADKLEVGSKVYVADNLSILKNLVEKGGPCDELLGIDEEDDVYKFIPESNDDTAFACAYLIEPPTELKWQDLKIGDVIRSKNTGIEYMVVMYSSHSESGSHVGIATGWICDINLSNFIKDEHHKN